jgi:hypothetical protein
MHKDPSDKQHGALKLHALVITRTMVDRRHFYDAVLVQLTMTLGQCVLQQTTAYTRVRCTGW